MCSVEEVKKNDVNYNGPRRGKHALDYGFGMGEVGYVLFHVFIFV